MGGRGSRSSRLGGGGGIPTFNAAMFGGGAPPPNVQPGQPVPAITQQQLQAMNDTEFVNYLNGLKNTPIDKNTYYNSDWDTQRLVANMPELNRAPQVVDAQTFASLPGSPIYRTVNAAGTESALDICGRTMSSDVTTIGAGVFGDGFYFAESKSLSQTVFGNTRGNIMKTATMTAKLNSNAKVVTERELNRMLSNESVAVQRAVHGMNSGNQWGGTGSGMMAYALKKGFNVVKRELDNVYNVIDRNAATWSSSVVPT